MFNYISNHIVKTLVIVLSVVVVVVVIYKYACFSRLKENVKMVTKFRNLVQDFFSEEEKLVCSIEKNIKINGRGFEDYYRNNTQNCIDKLIHNRSEEKKAAYLRGEINKIINPVFDILISIKMTNIIEQSSFASRIMDYEYRKNNDITYQKVILFLDRAIGNLEYNKTKARQQIYRPDYWVKDLVDCIFPSLKDYLLILSKFFKR